MNGRIIFSVLIIFLNVFSGRGFAQLVGGEGFLKGSHIEIGVAACGTYGTKDSSFVPPGYHNNCCPPFSGYGIGFVADPFSTGWNVPSVPSLTPPNYYCGDYFLPGDPEEGWCVKFGGVDYCNCNGLDTNFAQGVCQVNDITGTIVNVVDTGNLLSVCWNGSVNGLGVKQTTYFKKDSLYFTTLVTLTNTTAAMMDSVYYLRTLDPDNDIILSSNYATINTIVAQPNSSSDVALVTAVGSQYNCFLGLGTKDPRARVTHGGFTVRSASDIYNAVTGYSNSGTTAPGSIDEAISLAYFLGNLYPGQSETISYVHILDASQVNYALISSTNYVSAGNGPSATNISPNGSTYICAGDHVPLTILNGQDYSWTWSPSTDLNTDTGTTVMCIPQADRVYHLTGVSPLCDTRNFDITINLTWAPAYALGNDTTLCQSSSFWLKSNAQPPTTFLWSSGSTSDSILVASTGTYWVRVTNAICNAVSSDTLFANFLQLANLNLGNDTSLCSDPFYIDAGNQGYNFLWNTGDTTQRLLISSPGLYKVTASIAGDCPTSDSIHVQYYPAVDIHISPDVHIELDESTTLVVSGADHYTWSPSIWLSCDTCSSTVAMPQFTTTYHIEGVDINGCSSTDSVTVEVSHDETFYMPNAFTPNGDDINATFGAIGRYFSSGSMSIYDRWGNLVFYTTNLANGWDGSIGGSPSPAGVYVYFINGLWRSGKPFEQMGQLSLIR